MKKVKIMEGCWKKGGLHAHTLWSDGRSLPERAISAVKKAGFDFWSVTEHNEFPVSNNAWREICGEEGPWPPRLTEKEFNDARDIVPGRPEVRRNGWCSRAAKMMTFREMCRVFNEPDKFVLIPGCEFTNSMNTGPDGRLHAVHSNWLNIPEVPVLDHKLTKPEDMVDSHYAIYDEAAKRYNRPTYFQVNHPHWPYYDIHSTVIIERPWITHAELINGEAERVPPAGMANIEKWWDAVNAFRISAGQPCVFGTAGDDSHFYDDERGARHFGGLDGAFVVVHLPQKLTPDNLIRALNRGDFYFSTGVYFDSIIMDHEKGVLKVKVRKIKGAKCHIRFNVTRKDFDRTVTTRFLPLEGEPAYDRDVPVYSDDVGMIAYEKDGWTAEYKLSPDDLYVRATAVTDIRTIRNNGKPGPQKYHCYPEFLSAFTQPMVQEKE